MKKLIISVIFLGVILVAVIPYGTGWIAAQQLSLFNQSVEYLSGAKSTDKTYHRGWFTSTVRSEFNGSPIRRFTLFHKIHHGFQPLTATIVTTTVQSEWLQCLPESLKIQTVFHATGKTLYSTQAAECHWRQNPLQIHSRDLRSHIELQHHLKLTPLESSTETTFWRHFTQGMMELSLAKLQFSQPSQSPFTVSDLHSSVTADNHQDEFAFTMSMSFAALNFNEQHYRSGELELELQRWYAPAVVEIVNTLLTHQVQLSHYHSKLALLEVLMRQGAALFSHQPQLKIRRCHLATAEGRLEGTLQLTVAAGAFNVFSLQQLLKVEGSFKISRALLQKLIMQHFKREFPTLIPSEIEEKALQQLEQWLSQGILKSVENTDDYQLSIQMDQGKLQVNGQTLL